MLIFKNDDTHYIFIHIPKNGGKYLRTKILNTKNNILVKSYWNIHSSLDLAHIPYVKKDSFIDDIEYKYFTYTRCPYDRIISSFFYKNRNKTINDFKHFIKNVLPKYKFSTDFHSDIIHYYPQYLFLCDENLNVQKDIVLYKLDQLETPRKYNLNKFLDQECIHIINTVYHKDFLRLGYKMIKSHFSNYKNQRFRKINMKMSL